MRLVLMVAAVVLSLLFGCAGNNVNMVSPDENDSNGVEIVPYSPNETPGGNEVMDTQPIYFDPPAVLPLGVVGEQYNFSFCEPDVVSASGICESALFRYGPRLGNPPYHFQLESGSGFQPMGMVLNPNGWLSGKPTTAGTSSFSVCAVDQSGMQNCSARSIQIDDAKVVFDSLECQKMMEYESPRSTKYKIIAKGTAKGPKGATLLYADNLGELNEQYPDAHIYSDPEPGSSCGSWKSSETVVPRCTNTGSAGETSWTLVYHIWTGAKSITLHSSAYLELGDDYFNRQTTPVFREATCN